MTRRLASLAFLIVALLTSHELHAACASPAGVQGEMIYNGDYHTMQFCDGTKWISMAASGTATEVDPHVGTLQAGKWCASDGSQVICNQNAPISGGTWGTSGSDIYFSTGSVGIGTATPAATALLDVTSTTKGLLPPRMTTAQRDAISSPAAGLIIYNTTTTSVEVYNGTAWASIGASIPNGTIAAFAAATCPTGWTEFTAARGRFLRGIDNGAGNDPDGTRSPGAVQADMFKNHSHGLRIQNTGGSQSAWSMWNGNIGNGSELATSGTFDTGGTETRPKNVAVIFCSYSGGGGGGGGGSTTLGGLTDVNVSGVVNGQALVYNTASSKWIPGTATAGASGASGLVQFSNGTTLSSDTALYWDNSGKKLGIGTASPSTTLQVIGTATATTFSGAHSGDGSALTNLSATNLASGTVATARLGSGTASSSTYLRGDGAWAAVSGGALSSLSDVTLTSPVNGNVLTYNGSKWVNVGAGSAMGTTTMVLNWPDAIQCYGNGANRYLYLYNDDGTYIGYSVTNGSTTYIVNYTKATGAYYNTSNAGTWDCVTSAWSISQLYASGKAFNFIGTSLASAAAPAGGVQFNNGSGVLAADTALTWDNTNKRLGIGTTVPVSLLESYAATNGVISNNVYNNSAGANAVARYVLNTGTTYSYALMALYDNAAAPFMQYTVGPGVLQTYYDSPVHVFRSQGGTEWARIVGGNVGIGTTSPNSMLHLNASSENVIPIAAFLNSHNTTNGDQVQFWIGAAASSGQAGVLTHIYNSTAGLNYLNISLWGDSASSGAGLNIQKGGNVGIGNTNPNSPLDITPGAMGVGLSIRSGTSNYEGGELYLADYGNTTGWTYGNNAGWSIDNYANGLRFYRGSTQYYYFSTTDAAKPGGGVWASSSDRRLKDVQGDYTRGLADVSKLHTVVYRYKKANPRHEPSDRDFVGMIAQEVQPIFPEAVKKRADDYFDLDTSPVMFAMINAIKELKTDNDNLRREFEAYRAAHP